MKDDASVSELGSWVGDSDIDQNKEFSIINLEAKIILVISGLKFL